MKALVPILFSKEVVKAISNLSEHVIVLRYPVRTNTYLCVELATLVLEKGMQYMC